MEWVGGWEEWEEWVGGWVGGWMGAWAGRLDWMGGWVVGAATRDHQSHTGVLTWVRVCVCICMHAGVHPSRHVRAVCLLLLVLSYNALAFGMVGKSGRKWVDVGQRCSLCSNGRGLC